MSDGLPDFEAPPVAVQTALSLARRRLGMHVAFVSEVRDGRRIFTFVDSGLSEAPMQPGDAGPLHESYCRRVLDGSLAELAAMPTRERYGIRAYVSVPVTLIDRVVTSAEAMNRLAGSVTFPVEETIRRAAATFDESGRLEFVADEAEVVVVGGRRAVEAVLTAVTEHVVLQSVPSTPISVRVHGSGAHARVSFGYESLGVERAGEGESTVQRSSGAGVRLLLADTLARRLGGRLDFRLGPDGRATVDVTLPLVDA